MVKSPEEYFNDQNFNIEPQENGKFTPAERVFMQKYLGVDEKDLLESMGIQGGGKSVQDVAMDEMAPEESMEAVLKRESETQMVGFFIGDQEFVIPTFTVQEVIRYKEPARLPMAPPHVSGIINLRGRVTPVMILRDLLAVHNKSRPISEGAYIICRRQGLQIGLHVEKVHTMYRAKLNDLEWSVEFNADSDFVCGLMKHDGDLLGIVSVDKIVKFVLK